MTDAITNRAVAPCSFVIVVIIVIAAKPLIPAADDARPMNCRRRFALG
ncbi:hypothetical protein JD76_02751 [Micromonospora endolithica]|nr:hypothetical protein JD76_02751 [Micromonospora endolithica]